MLTGILFQVCLFPAFSQETLSQEGMEILRKKLQEGVNSLNPNLEPRELPPVIFDKDLRSNGRYERDTIWMGIPQEDFHTEGDIMSLIFHEYVHFRLEEANEYPVARDSAGKIVQFITDEMYEYTPTPLEVDRELSKYRIQLADSFPDLDEQKRTYLINTMRKTLSQTQRLHFQYAPSNLALEEGYAYQSQLKGHKEFKLYKMSLEGLAAVDRRIRQLADTYARRVDYEKRMGLGPDGRKIMTNEE